MTNTTTNTQETVNQASVTPATCDERKKARNNIKTACICIAVPIVAVGAMRFIQCKAAASGLVENIDQSLENLENVCDEVVTLANRYPEQREEFRTFVQRSGDLINELRILRSSLTRLVVTASELNRVVKQMEELRSRNQMMLQDIRNTIIMAMGRTKAQEEGWI